MVKTASFEDSDKGEGEVHPDLSNGINEAMLKGFVADIEAEQIAIDEIMENARVACQPHVDKMKEIAKDAAECGIEKKAFKAKLRERNLRRKADKCRATLSERQQEVFDEISQKLGDLFDFADKAEAAAH
jgi:hypothetical protein